MKATVEIDAGICGLQTRAEATSEDSQHVMFDIETTCEKIALFGEAAKESGPIDAYQEISSFDQSVLLQAARKTLTGCCAGCVVPVGLFKAMQVAAGLALPKDISITLTKE